MRRRSALRLAGAGGLLAAAGGTLLTGCGSGSGGGGSSTARSAAPSGTGSAKVAAKDQPLLTPAGHAPSTRRATWSQQFQADHGWSAGGTVTASPSPTTRRCS